MKNTSESSVPATDASGEPSRLGKYNGFEVYPMPLFVTLTVDDPAALAEWYQRALGFDVMFAGPLIHLRRRKYQDLLLVRPAPGMAASARGPVMNFNADGEIDQLAAQATAAPSSGGSSVEGPINTPWNTRDLRVTDPAGNRLVFTGRRPDPDPQAIENWKAAFAAAQVKPLLYRDLVPWYRLVDPPADHFDEAACYQAAFERAASPRPQTLLDLGAGGGHNAFHLKRRFRCTLSDLSEDMLALSRALNPECEHVAGDMRTLRLHREFDVVLVHDAVTYMTTGEDLSAAAMTAFVHTRPGGAAIFAPDCLRETFRESSHVLEGSDGARALRGLEWTWDPDPTDSTYRVEYALLLREGDAVSSVHDRHIEGLFSKETWHRVLTGAGFRVEMIERPIDEGELDEIFLCRRPSR